MINKNLLIKIFINKLGNTFSKYYPFINYYIDNIDFISYKNKSTLDSLFYICYNKEMNIEGICLSHCKVKAINKNIYKYIDKTLSNNIDIVLDFNGKYIKKRIYYKNCIIKKKLFSELDYLYNTFNVEISNIVCHYKDTIKYYFLINNNKNLLIFIFKLANIPYLFLFFNIREFYIKYKKKNIHSIKIYTFNTKKVIKYFNIDLNANIFYTGIEFNLKGNIQKVEFYEGIKL